MHAALAESASVIHCSGSSAA